MRLSVKTLFIGGIKSGKSKLAEEFVLNKQSLKPYYIATSEFIDEGIQERITLHKEQRKNTFITIEEPLNLYQNISTYTTPILIECLTIWLNNILYHKKSHHDIFQEIDLLLTLNQDITFVLNDVGSGIIPDNALAREFVDLSGKIAQKIALNCDKVYFCIAGLAKEMK